MAQGHKRLRREGSSRRRPQRPAPPSPVAPPPAQGTVHTRTTKCRQRTQRQGADVSCHGIYRTRPRSLKPFRLPLPRGTAPPATRLPPSALVDRLPQHSSSTEAVRKRTSPSESPPRSRIRGEALTALTRSEAHETTTDRCVLHGSSFRSQLHGRGVDEGRERSARGQNHSGSDHCGRRGRSVVRRGDKSGTAREHGHRGCANLHRRLTLPTARVALNPPRAQRMRGDYGYRGAGGGA
jgi:hypothetical protein